MIMEPTQDEFTQRFCEYKHIAGRFKGSYCGRFLRKKDTIVCGKHRSYESSVQRRKDLEEAARRERERGDPLFREIDVEPGEFLETRAIAPPVVRPLTPTRFTGILEKNRKILGDETAEALRDLKAVEVRDMIRKLETEEFDEDPEVGQAMYEELIRLRDIITT